MRERRGADRQRHRTRDSATGASKGLNTKVRLLVRRAYGFHSADAALALVMLELRTNHPHPAPRTSRGMTHIDVRRAGIITGVAERQPADDPGRGGP